MDMSKRADRVLLSSFCLLTSRSAKVTARSMSNPSDSARTHANRMREALDDALSISLDEAK